MNERENLIAVLTEALEHAHGDAKIDSVAVILARGGTEDATRGIIVMAFGNDAALCYGTTVLQHHIVDSAREENARQKIQITRQLQ